MQFVKFMTSGTGRRARIMAGLVLIALGLGVVQGALGTIVALVALVPIAGGVFDFCLVGAALGYGFSGAEARRKLAGK
jgi:hypothetical protein